MNSGSNDDGGGETNSAKKSCTGPLEKTPRVPPARSRARKQFLKHFL